MNEPMSRETESVEQAVGKGQETPLPLLRVYLFYEQMQLAWPHESRVKALGELLH